MSLILIVSCGVLTTIASAVPATSPAMNPFTLPNIGLPSDVFSMSEAASKAEKRRAALGVAK